MANVGKAMTNICVKHVQTDVIFILITIQEFLVAFNVLKIVLHVRELLLMIVYLVKIRFIL